MNRTFKFLLVKVWLITFGLIAGCHSCMDHEDCCSALDRGCIARFGSEISYVYSCAVCAAESHKQAEDWIDRYFAPKSDYHDVLRARRMKKWMRGGYAWIYRINIDSGDVYIYQRFFPEQEHGETTQTAQRFRCEVSYVLEDGSSYHDDENIDYIMFHSNEERIDQE